MPDRDYAVIVLAAGRASRFGGAKLSAPLDGEPLLSHALRSARAAPASRRVLVTRENEATDGFDTVLVQSDALSTSLRAGLAAVAGCDGVFIFLGDMPRIPVDVAGKLAGAIGEAPAAFPVFGGRPGHPLLLAAHGFALADDLAGDRGLGAVLHGRADVVRVPVSDAGVIFDVDTRADLARAQGAASC